MYYDNIFESTNLHTDITSVQPHGSMNQTLEKKLGDILGYSLTVSV